MDVTVVSVRTPDAELEGPLLEGTHVGAIDVVAAEVGSNVELVDVGEGANELENVDDEVVAGSVVCDDVVRLVVVDGSWVVVELLVDEADVEEEVNEGIVDVLEGEVVCEELDVSDVVGAEDIESEDVLEGMAEEVVMTLEDEEDILPRNSL
ncbi:hypothetical protein J132_05453 [Termitomyces sp. J132]|nr:hypothetical protein J132_05453 [Termitomyces sp. J132]